MINKKAKWEQEKNKATKDLSSDIITVCLRTLDETLSLWYLENDSEIDDAIIALSSGRDLINNIDYLIIPDNYVVKYSLVLKENIGRSPYEKFNKNHRDIIDINYSILGVISTMILDVINNGGEIVRVYDDKVQEKLSSALENGFLNTKTMKPSLLKKIS